MPVPGLGWSQYPIWPHPSFEALQGSGSWAVRWVLHGQGCLQRPEPPRHDAHSWGPPRLQQVVMVGMKDVG